MTMHIIDTEQFVDLGDAVAETKGAAPFGQIDMVTGYRQLAGIEDAD